MRSLGLQVEKMSIQKTNGRGVSSEMLRLKTKSFMFYTPHSQFKGRGFPVLVSTTYFSIAKKNPKPNQPTKKTHHKTYTTQTKQQTKPTLKREKKK